MSNRSNSPVFCEHANEVPARCPCRRGCYCKKNTCRPEPSSRAIVEEAIDARKRGVKWTDPTYSDVIVNKRRR